MLNKILINVIIVNVLCNINCHGMYSPLHQDYESSMQCDEGNNLVRQSIHFSNEDFSMQSEENNIPLAKFNDVFKTELVKCQLKTELSCNSLIDDNNNINNNQNNINQIFYKKSDDFINTLKQNNDKFSRKDEIFDSNKTARHTVFNNIVNERFANFIFSQKPRFIR